MTKALKIKVLEYSLSAKEAKLMKKIVFVCHGNICRSPMAEFVFKRMLTERGGADKVEVCSMAVSAEELGNPVYPPARAELLRHGIGCDGKYAVRIGKSDYEKFDLIICMDDSNLRGLMRLFGGDPDGKIKKLLDYTDRGGSVADPWYTGDFSEAFSDVCEGCEAVYAHLFESK